MGSWPDSALNLRTEARREQNEYPTWFLVVPEEANTAERAAGIGCPAQGMHARHGYFLRPGARRNGRVRAADRDAHLPQKPAPLFAGGSRRGVVPAQTRACPALSPDTLWQTAGPGGDRTGGFLRRDAARRRIAAAHLRRSDRGFPDLRHEPQRYRTAHARAVGGGPADYRGAEPAAGALRGAAGGDGLSQRSGAHRRRPSAAESGAGWRGGADHPPGTGRYDRSAAGIGHEGPR